jgi:hypothetical protein
MKKGDMSAARAAKKAGPREFNWIKKSKDNPKSKTIAIKAFCFSCMGGTLEEMPDEGWKDDIRTCSAATCPLYRFRPYKKRGEKYG